MTLYSQRNKEKEKSGITMIIPVLNRVEMVADTLASVEAQTRRPDKLILVDNGSADGTWEYLYQRKEELEKLGWDVSVKREVRPGASRARQTGLEFTDTRYVMFFDSDDIMHEDHVEKIMLDFESDPTLDISVWGVTFCNPDGKRRRRRVLPCKLLENHLVQGLLSTQGYAVRTSLLRQAGGWNVSVGGWDDWELGLRLLMQNPVVKVNREWRVDVRVQEESITGIDYAHRAGDWEKTLRIMSEYVRASEYADRDYILKMLAYRKVILGAHYHREGYAEAGAELRDEAIMETPELTARDERLLHMAYRVTAYGLPGAGAIFPPLIRKGK